MTLRQVFPLDLQGGELPAVGEPDEGPAAEVVGDLADAADGVFHPHVPHDHPGLDHPQDQVHGADLQQGRGFGHVGVADDDVQPAVELGVGVRLVPGVDDGPGPGGGGGDALPDVVRPLREREGGAVRGLQDLAGTGDQLAGHEERDQDFREPGEFPAARDEVVFVAAVGVPGGIGVVLEQVDRAVEALGREPFLRLVHEVVQDQFAGAVMGDQLGQVVAFGGGVLGVRADVEVQA